MAKKIFMYTVKGRLFSYPLLLFLLVGCLLSRTPFTPPSSIPPTQSSIATTAPLLVSTNTASPTSSATCTGTALSKPPSPSSTPTPNQVVRFAVIGDYGTGNQFEDDVAKLIKSWNPDFIITTGDNNYPLGQASTIDNRVGQFFHEYIFPYKGKYGKGAEFNRFFPSLGNHDWLSEDAQPYLDYFTLPGNERYYDFTWGPLHLFAIDSDSNEPDGVGSKSKQASWLREKLAAAPETWKIVYMHQPPFSSGMHGSIEWARWPYREWGATAVLGGHDHTYERLVIDGLAYFVNGLGGGDIYYFKTILEGSQKRYSNDYGAMRVTVDDRTITFEFITRNGVLVDTYTIKNKN
jgi:tartrate-resistant acid phosphatase type 5